MSTLSIAVAQDNTAVISALKKAVAESYAITALAHTAHWNVVGSDFFQLHEAFGSIYESNFDNADLLAERIRALQGLIKADLTEMDMLAAMPKLTPPFSGQEAVSTVLAALEKAANDLKTLTLVAKAAGDTVTENMVLSLIESNQKSQWMLRSYLKT